MGKSVMKCPVSSPVDFFLLDIDPISGENKTLTYSL